MYDFFIYMIFYIFLCFIYILQTDLFLLIEMRNCVDFILNINAKVRGFYIKYNCESAVFFSEKKRRIFCK